ncbi:hypothetical protein JHK82_039609 [Glycine max]|nr:hypothetical protein JHK86_039798 [Glycine max]KAG5110386.1 hypothetical protein JHK82_039609 [Glycine max]
MGRDFNFEVGMEFDSISQFKAVIKEYANLHGFGVKFKKNDNVRCRVICQDGCQWVAYVSKVGGSTTYSMKTYNEKHTCARSSGGKLASSKWIAEKLIEPLKYTPNMSINAVIQKVSERYYVKISSKKAYWARRIAKEKVSKEAHDWLMQLDLRFWSKAHMSEYSRNAMAAMFDRRLLPSDSVHPYYHVNTYINCYAPILEPINGEDMWQQTGLPTVLPPQVRVPIGIPKKARRRENDEAPKPHKLKRTNTSLRCSRCGTFGHNKRVSKHDNP